MTCFKQLVTQYGFPTEARPGYQVHRSREIRLLLWHYIRSITEHKMRWKVLSLLYQLVKQGQFNPYEYAELADRANGFRIFKTYGTDDLYYLAYQGKEQAASIKRSLPQKQTMNQRRKALGIASLVEAQSRMLFTFNNSEFIIETCGRLVVNIKNKNELKNYVVLPQK